MGEGGAVAPPAAIANAVRDALASIGAEVNETPITPRRVLYDERVTRRRILKPHAVHRLDHSPETSDVR
jgi:hypothetical protein